MNNSWKEMHKIAGFSLIEIIVTIIVIGIVGTMLVTFVSANLRTSIQPVFNTKRMLLQQEAVEDITVTYLSMLDRANMENDFASYLDAMSSNSNLDIKNNKASFDDGQKAYDNIRTVTLSSENMGSSLIAVVAYYSNQ